MARFLREVETEATAPVSVILWVMVSVLMVVTGPFGTAVSLPAWERALVWPPVVAGPIALACIAHLLLQRHRPGLATWGSALAVATGVAVLIGPACWWGGQALLPVRAAGLPGPAEAVGLVWFLVLGLGALRASVQPAKAAGGDAIANADPVEPLRRARLLDRLTPAAAGDLVAISVRDHYVDVQTSAGEFSLLMRLTDAIAETDGVDGAQVHRSHWVAWSAVVAAERAGGKLALRLVNGRSLPVSKTHLAKLVDRGLIAPGQGRD